MNLYRYVDNGPTNGIDPSGMWNPFKVKQDATRKRRPGLVTGADILNDMHRRNAAMRPIVEQYDHAIQKGKAIGQAGQRMFAEAAFGPVVPAAEAIGGKDVFKTECNQLTPKQRAKSAAWAAFYVVQIFANDFIEAGRLAFFCSADEAAELSHSGAASRLLAAEERDVAQNAAREGLELAEDAAQVARTSERLNDAARVCKNAPRSSQVATATTKQLQKKFKHAGDFGVTGNPNKANLSKFRQAIQDHLNNPATEQINGTYRGNPAIINVDPNTGLAVIRNPNGGFVSGWKLSPDQWKHVLSSGKLGGG